MIKRTALICFSLVASSAAVPGLSYAQFVLPTPAQAQEPEAAPSMPDDVRLALMIRNAVVALNQANLTGNYTVAREMGTADFQMTNSPARLAEVFATLRSRKIDLSPVMVFNPKLPSAPPWTGKCCGYRILPDLARAGAIRSRLPARGRSMAPGLGSRSALRLPPMAPRRPRHRRASSCRPPRSRFHHGWKTRRGKADPHRFEPAGRRRASHSRRSQEAGRGEKAEAPAPAQKAAASQAPAPAAEAPAPRHTRSAAGRPVRKPASGSGPSLESLWPLS